MKPRARVKHRVRPWRHISRQITLDSLISRGKTGLENDEKTEAGWIQTWGD